MPLVNLSKPKSHARSASDAADQVEAHAAAAATAAAAAAAPVAGAEKQRCTKCKKMKIVEEFADTATNESYKKCISCREKAAQVRVSPVMSLCSLGGLCDLSAHPQFVTQLSFLKY